MNSKFVISYNELSLFFNSLSPLFYEKSIGFGKPIIPISISTNSKTKKTIISTRLVSPTKVCLLDRFNWETSLIDTDGNPFKLKEDLKFGISDYERLLRVLKLMCDEKDDDDFVFDFSDTVKDSNNWTTGYLKISRYDNYGVGKSHPSFNYSFPETKYRLCDSTLIINPPQLKSLPSQYDYEFKIENSINKLLPLLKLLENDILSFEQKNKTILEISIPSTTYDISFNTKYDGNKILKQHFSGLLFSGFCNTLHSPKKTKFFVSGQGLLKFETETEISLPNKNSKVNGTIYFVEVIPV